MPSKTQSIDPSQAQWDDRPAKRTAEVDDMHAMKSWMEARRRVRILSMPAAGWYWERNMARMFPQHVITFEGAEKDEKVFPLMREQAKKLNAKAVRQEYRSPPKPLCVGKLLKHWPGRPFDMIYLDWMGTWSKEKYQHLSTMFERGMLAADGILRFTISVHRGHEAVWRALLPKNPQVLPVRNYRGNENNLLEWKLFGVPSLVADLAGCFDRRVKAMPPAVYNSRANISSPGYPEAAFTFHIK